jgi:hypothetical protein
VAVHGLYGHVEDTWSTESPTESSKSNWIENLIHKGYPNSRILSFGYDTEKILQSVDSRQSIGAIANRLLDDLVKLRQTLSEVRTDVKLPLALEGSY